MKPPTIDHMILILQAIREGKTIQIIDPYDSVDIWEDVVDLEPHEFAWDAYEFRVKPEPREFWINEYKGGDLYAHESEQSAGENSKAGDHSPPSFIRTIHVREVL